MSIFSKMVFFEIADSEFTGADDPTLWLRVGGFLLALLVFVLVCGFAWRTLPVLRAFIPEFKPGESSLEARTQKKLAEQAEARALALSEDKIPHLAPPDLSKRPKLSVQSLTLNSVAEKPASKLVAVSQTETGEKTGLVGIE